MSDGKIDVAAQPLVIVRRRRSGGEEAHHGGVWKIAYADFMTAMMAFFLVMWLVNAADKKTIVQVAAYFNPVHLTDKTPSTKGIEDPSNVERKKETKKKEGRDAAEKEDERKGADAGSAHKQALDEYDAEAKAPRNLSKTAGQAAKDEALFSDPMGVLDKLAKEAVLPGQDGPKSGNSAVFLRDPFDPAHKIFIDPALQPAVKPSSAKPQPATDGPIKDQRSKPKATAVPSVAVNPSESGAERQADAAKLEGEIRGALAPLGSALPNIDIKATTEGILISLTDAADFGMFAVGSAEPRPEVVVALATIAGILKSLEGRIVIRGHTDGRAYKSGTYDNWRLSAARAQMSYHMLVRGGIEPSRFLSIEGRADSELKVLQDKAAAQNRRIDILIQGGKS